MWHSLPRLGVHSCNADGESWQLFQRREAIESKRGPRRGTEELEGTQTDFSHHEIAEDEGGAGLQACAPGPKDQRLQPLRYIEPELPFQMAVPQRLKPIS